MTAADRWLVERPNDEYDDVGADAWRVESGALVFYDAQGDRALAYAPGTWLYVCETAT